MTIKDIARISGYGIGTVSRVINNHPDVSEKARKKIMDVIEEYNFKPNANAKHLKMQASTSIFIIVKGTHNLLFADIVEQMQTLFSKKGESTSIYYIDEDENEVEYAVSLCRTRNPKGILFLGGNLGYFKKGFSPISVPCILLTNDASELGFDNLSSVTTCDQEGAYRAIDYLISKGHSNIGVIGGNLSCTEVSFFRLAGVKEGFEKNHTPFDQKTQLETCRFSMEEGYDAAKRLLKHNPSITAIFAMCDLIALGAIRAIYDMGKKVPEDISIIGYDGIMLSNYSTPRLTTICQDTTQLAKKGVDLILQRISYPYHAVHKITPFILQEGESVNHI